MPSALRQLLALGFVVLAAPLHAQDAPRPLEVRGFGSWAYGRSTHNNFLAGSPEGDYRQISLALNVSKRLDDKLSIQTQGEVHASHGETEVEVDFAFATYRLNDHLAFHIGQLKHPFGLYTEVFDVGTLRPFINLPQGFYGAVGFAGEAHKGLGVSGTADVGAWTVAYDVYAGGNDVIKSAIPKAFYEDATLQGVSEQFEEESNRNVIGGRVVLKTPLQGLSFGSSSYTGTDIEAEGNRRRVIAGQVSYRSNTVTLESEIAHQRETDERATGGYVLAAYRLTPEWQIAAQYDKVTNRFPLADVTAVPSLQDHRQGAFGISRWFSRSLVIKAEYHRVSGNTFAMPEPDDLPAIAAANELRTTTHLFQFGAQFTF